jgi:hypothetical protein
MSWWKLQSKINNFLYLSDQDMFSILWKGKNPIYCGVIRSKVKVTITINRIFDNRVVSTWSSLVKIQYTELKLSRGNDPVVNNSIYSNGDLDLWPNDPKINRVCPLPQGNHVAKSVKDPIYRAKVIVQKRPCCQIFFS